MDWSAIKSGLERFLPIGEAIAKLTPTTADDAAIAFLKALLASSAGPPLVHEFQAKGLLPKWLQPK